MDRNLILAQIAADILAEHVAELLAVRRIIERCRSPGGSSPAADVCPGKLPWAKLERVQATVNSTTVKSATLMVRAAFFRDFMTRSLQGISWKALNGGNTSTEEIVGKFGPFAILEMGLLGGRRRLFSRTE